MPAVPAFSRSGGAVPKNFAATRRTVRASGRFRSSLVRRQCRSRFAGRRGTRSARADVLIIFSAPLVPASSRRPRRAVCFTSCFPLFLPSRLRLFFAARLRKCRPAARLSIFLILPRRIYCASRRWSSAFPCGARRTARLAPLLFPAREERHYGEQRERAEARRAAAASAPAFGWRGGRLGHRRDGYGE